MGILRIPLVIFGLLVFEGNDKAAGHKGHEKGPEEKALVTHVGKMFDIQPQPAKPANSCYAEPHTNNLLPVHNPNLSILSGLSIYLLFLLFFRPNVNSLVFHPNLNPKQLKICDSKRRSLFDFFVDIFSPFKKFSSRHSTNRLSYTYATPTRMPQAL
jgi:hypothetical protein